MIKINDVRFYDLLPHNFKTVHNKSLSKAVETEFNKLIQNVYLVNVLCSVNTLTDDILNVLAIQMRVDGYINSMNIQTKRNLINNSIIYFMSMGTKSIIEDKITEIFGDGKVIEWFEEKNAASYTFKVETTNQNVNQSMADEFSVVIQSVKNARSVLSEVVIKLSNSQKTYIGNVLHIADNFILRQVNK